MKCVQFNGTVFKVLKNKQTHFANFIYVPEQCLRFDSKNEFRFMKSVLAIVKNCNN